MAVLDRRQLLAGLGTGLLAGCEGQFQLADGTRPPAEGGIGGTGIVGIVTGFSSLLINGLRVDLPPAAVITDPFGTVSAEALRVRQSLTVEAAGGLDDLVARRVVITYPLVGPIEGVLLDGRRLIVLGTEVRLEAGLGTVEDLGLRAGQQVAVAGLWQGDRVIASAVTPVEAPVPDAMSGALGAAPGGGLRLGALSLTLQGGVAAPPVGSFATVTGVRQGEAFGVQTLEPGRFTGAAGPLQRLSVEGYLDPVATAPGFAVAGLGHSFNRRARLRALADRRALFVGPYDGTFDAAYGAELPERFDPRVEALSEIAAGARRVPTR